MQILPVKRAIEILDTVRDRRIVVLGDVMRDDPRFAELMTKVDGAKSQSAGDDD